jgi:hypothetical protein
VAAGVGAAGDVVVVMTGDVTGVGDEDDDGNDDGGGGCSVVLVSPEGHTRAVTATRTPAIPATLPAAGHHGLAYQGSWPSVTP